MIGVPGSRHLPRPSIDNNTQHSHVLVIVCTLTILYILHIGMCAILSIPAPRHIDSSTRLVRDQV